MSAQYGVTCKMKLWRRQYSKNSVTSDLAALSWGTWNFPQTHNQCSFIKLIKCSISQLSYHFSFSSFSFFSYFLLLLLFLLFTFFFINIIIFFSSFLALLLLLMLIAASRNGSELELAFAYRQIWVLIFGQFITVVADASPLPLLVSLLPTATYRGIKRNYSYYFFLSKFCFLVFRLGYYFASYIITFGVYYWNELHSDIKLKIIGRPYNLKRETALLLNILLRKSELRKAAH